MRTPTPAPVSSSRSRETARGVSFADVSLLVAAALGVPVEEIESRTRRSAAAAFARQCAMYLAHVVLGANYSEIGECFRRDRTTVAHACRLIEERREEAGLDGLLTAIENALCAQLKFAAGPRSSAGTAR